MTRAGLALNERGYERLVASGLDEVRFAFGVTESFNQRDEEFGEDRLIEALRRHRGLRPNEVVASIFNEVRRFSPDEQRDDVTLIVARVRC